MNKALDDHDIATGHVGTRRRDWRKAMSDNVALALLVYTGLQIFMTVGAMKQPWARSPSVSASPPARTRAPSCFPISM